MAAEATTPDAVDLHETLTTVSPDEARDLLVDLVSIPSPSGEERKAAQRLVAFFEAHGREAWLDAIGNVRAPADDAVLLTSHVDTVPGDIPVRVEDGVLWGRGSVDATGPLAAMAVVAVETGVSFVGVVGEEKDSRGAHHLVADREPPEALVNGEPSGWDGLTLGYRGILGGRYGVQTEGQHTSRPSPNAIEQAMAWWRRVQEAFAPDDESEGAEADAGSTFEQVTTKPVSFDGGVTDDGLATNASMEVQLRVPPSKTVDEVRETAEAQLEAGSLSWVDELPPAMQSPRTPVARAFRVAIRQLGGDPRLLRKTGTSDVNVYTGAWDVPMATYGPGDSSLDHAPDERLPLAEYDRSIAVLATVCERLID